jgi:glycosyltransferase involved in cell wall biosynthesis
LERLKNQRTDGLFTYSVVVADNDAACSAKKAATNAAEGKLQITYCVEPQQNIALARNRALAHAEGDFVAFIDDDEFPIQEWLCNLFKTCQEHGVDGVLGPVKPHFESEPPRWVKDGHFFERPTYVTGHKLGWGQSRTGNVLFRKNILIEEEPPFRAHFDTAGEDVDFFRRMADKGCNFIWCNEAVAYEVVPASRCTRRYLLRRALLRGSNFPKHPTRRLKHAAMSVIAVPCYTIALPILALFGQHLALKYLIKLCDHSSRLLAFLGWRLVSQRQT